MNVTTAPRLPQTVRPQVRAAAPAPVKPAGETALVVGGTSFPTLSAEQMAGLTNTNAGTLVNVPYPAMIRGFNGDKTLGESVAAGADKLVSMLKEATASAKSVVVWGISQGALVIDAAMKKLAGDPNRPAPDAVTLVRVADPATSVTGMLNFVPPFILRALGITKTDTKVGDSAYDTAVIVNQYDAFADFPNRFNPLAVVNALFGLFTRHGQTATADLSTVPAKNISTTVNKLGATITTYLVPATTLPLTQPLRNLGVPAAWVDGLDRFLRPIIEAGYVRPAGDGGKVAPAAPKARRAG